MKTAVITCIDDNVSKNLEIDFLETLRGDACYKGSIYVVYYGEDQEFMKRIKDKYDANVVCSYNELIPSNQRSFDFFNLINNLPEHITHVMCIDGGDVWFQKPIDEIFNITENGYGFVEENQNADEDFNLNCINEIKDDSLKLEFLKKVQGYKLINGGFIVGNKNKVSFLLKSVAELTEKIHQDFFALDQVILNYLIRSDGNGFNIPKKYCYTLLSDKNKFFVDNGLIYDKLTKELISIIHNIGSVKRIYKNGRVNLNKIASIDNFWGLTTFFNPAKYKNKAENYRIFRENSKRQGLRLLCVELAFNNDEFELTENDADILIQVRSNSVMWQKERLLNIGLKNLPENCDKVTWLDCDIIFKNDNWIKETCELLGKYTIVQPYSFVAKLKKGLDKEDARNFPFGFDDGNFSHGIAHSIGCSRETIIDSQNFSIIGNVGYAWAARREFLDACGFYDKSIMGANDTILAYALYGKKYDKLLRLYPGKLLKDVEDYIKKVFSFVRGDCYYLNDIILHVWHGDYMNRGYKTREGVFERYDFDPYEDIKLNEDECWEWASDKKKIHDEAKNYFFERKEA